MNPKRPAPRDEIRVDGKKEAAELLASLEESAREKILAGIAKSDPKLAETLRKGMFTFEQVLRLEPASFQKVVRTLPSQVLALAARGLAPEAEGAFFSRFSERQGRALREEREALGPRKLSEVTAAREKITDLARALHAAGEINLLQAPRI